MEVLHILLCTFIRHVRRHITCSGSHNLFHTNLEKKKAPIILQKIQNPSLLDQHYVCPLLKLTRLTVQTEAALAGGGWPVPQPVPGPGHQDGCQAQGRGRGQVHHQPQQLEHVHAAGRGDQHGVRHHLTDISPQERISWIQVNTHSLHCRSAQYCREVMVMENTNPMMGTCGTISWQLVEINMRLIIMWSVPFNFNIRDSYYAIGLTHNKVVFPIEKSAGTLIELFVMRAASTFCNKNILVL